MISLVRDRLLQAAPSLASVEIAESIEAVAKGTRPTSGACFVVPYREPADENSLITGGHRQLVHVEILTVLFVRHDDDVRGAARALRFDALKGAVEGALAGWSPSEGSDPFALVGGQSGTILPLNASVWIQTWETTRYLTGA